MGTSSRWTIALICILLLVSFTLQASAEPWWKRQTQQTNGNNNNGGQNNGNNNNGGQNNGNNNNGGQNNNSTNQQASGSGSAGPQPTGNSTTNGNNTSNSTSSNSTSPSNSTSSPTKTQTANAGAPAAIQMTTPAITQSKPLYKIGSNVTFAWKWLNPPSIQPRYLLLFAQATVGKTTYPIGNISATSTSYLWITAQQAQPLVMSDYTLYITDERGISGAPEPGRLEPYSALIFSMYQPQSYTGLDGYTCATCNDGSFPLVPIFMTFGVTIITVVTFGFFMA